MKNLLLRYYDLQCELLIRGFITYPDFEKLELEYKKKSELVWFGKK